MKVVTSFSSPWPPAGNDQLTLPAKALKLPSRITEFDAVK